MFRQMDPENGNEHTYTLFRLRSAKEGFINSAMASKIWMAARCNLVMMSPTISRVTSYKIPQQVFLRHLRYLMLANKSVDAILLGGKAI